MASGFYTCLDSSIQKTRILKLAPSNLPTATIKCTLHIVDLDQNPLPNYIALSYVWGDPNRTSPIQIDGISWNVTVNLESALRHIRRTDEEVLLWADAVCINQSNPEERSRQVSMMGSIYSKAEMVIAWLGEESDDSNLALQLIEQWSRWLRHRGAQDVELDEIDENIPDAFDAKTIAATQAMVERVYWTRIWILQELSLAKRVDALCGRNRLPLLNFRTAARAWAAIFGGTMYERASDRRSMQYLSLCCSPMGTMMSVVHAIARDCNLDFGYYLEKPKFSVDFLVGLETFKASDPRDRVYGVLGILPQDTSSTLQPDYTKPVEDVYCETAKILLQEEQSLRLVCAAIRNNQTSNPLGLPSWVPDWENCNMDLPLARDVPWHRKSAIQFGRVVRLTSNNRILWCKGCVLDHVQEIYHKSVSNMDGKDILVLLRKIFTGTQFGDISALQAFYRAISLDSYGYDQDRRRLIPGSTDYYRQAVLFLLLLATELEPYMPPSSEISATDLLEAAFIKNTDDTQVDNEKLLLCQALEEDLDILVYRNCLSERIPFRTKNGKMGVGTNQVSPGDVICHLAGHSFPFILHQESDYYCVRGECYISGLELPELTVDDISKMQEFEIR